MTTTLSPPATRPPTLTLDQRLALASLAMDDRLDQAAVAFEVNTARIPSEPPVDLAGPILPVLEPQPASAVAPLAACLRQARNILQERGWTRGELRRDGAVCAVAAIRAAAASRSHADDACAILLDAIRQELPDAATVPSWNDAQTTAGPVLRMLDKAAQLAERHGFGRSNTSI